MRARQHTGRPGTPVIPARWSEAPRTVMAKTRTGCATLRHQGSTPGDFDPVTGGYPDAVAEPAYWTGTCRVQAEALLSAIAHDVAGEDVTTVGYLVTVDVNATDPADELRIGDLIRVTDLDPNGDKSLIGRDLTIISIGRGTLAWERDLGCLDQIPPAPQE